MRIALGVIVASVFLMPALVFAQTPQDFQVVKTERSESFVLPYAAVNRNEQDPLVYTFDEPKQPNWIITIQNNVSYVPREGARTIIKIQEPEPSEKYIELAIYGDQSMRYWVGVNTAEAGYARMYDSENGWSTEQPISVTHTENSGLIVTNGKRTVVDRLDVDGFAVASIEVYGNDRNSNLANASAGEIAFEVLFGRFDESPIFYVPLAVGVGIFGLVAGLLILKKRKPSD
ncbi:MAG TPA: hypothetical protein VHJ59_00685 [Nitrososphaera sp.]|jgi:hypothetical protein|nr:hypothetical protein [Nitrososphaera sp.]